MEFAELIKECDDIHDLKSKGVVVEQETVVGTTRWGIIYETVVEHEGRFWRVSYEEGATESQDSGYGWSDEPPTVVEVKPVERTVTVYEKV